ncbi:MAG: glucose-6-phosphate isomerase [Rhizobiaceae bacterium]
MTNKDRAAALTALRAHFKSGAPKDMRKAFDDDKNRFKKLSVSFDDLLLDYSKSAVNGDTMKLLQDLATACDLKQKRDAMFAGAPINATEGRAVLHTALRNRSGRPAKVDGKSVMNDVNAVLARMGKFAEDIRSGAVKGARGKAFTDVVNIGIGGSDLGPVMTTLALAPYHDGPNLHYVSNVDGAHMADTLKRLNPATTLIIVASKTFTTIETMTNAETARRWLEKALDKKAVGAHFAAISTALDKVSAFGIDEARVFGFWDWVGGRYSVWSAIGLPLMIAVGKDNFGRFLDGASAMDEHFRAAPFAKNLPVALGLIGFWNRVICGHPTRAVIPYDQRLSRMPAYLQQLDMESNGKRVMQDGSKTDTVTGPVVWGEPGTNGQHAFFQLLHQGTDIVPVEFIVGAQSHEPDLQVHQELLLANCLAQSEALMRGRTLAEAKAQLKARGLSADKINTLAPHRVFPGNRPTLTLVHKKLDPFALGRLIALYEHRVFVEAQLFGINAFDQWGVELGKELATELLPVVQGTKSAAGRDSSTAGLVAHIKNIAKGGN